MFFHPLATRQHHHVRVPVSWHAHLVPSEQQLPHQYPADSSGGAAHEHRREAGLRAQFHPHVFCTVEQGHAHVCNLGVSWQRVSMQKLLDCLTLSSSCVFDVPSSLCAAHAA